MANIKIVNAALQERGDGVIILRGVLDIESVPELKVDSYQREDLGKRPLRQAVANNADLPDIELGMRGENFTSKGDTFVLHDPTYIIDGWQRVNAIIVHLASVGRGESDTLIDSVGVTVRFNTDQKKEKARFDILNGARTPVSPNIKLRNARDIHPCIMQIYGLSQADQGFPLYRRVTWTQKRPKTDLTTANNILFTARSLHAHVLSDLFESVRGNAKSSGSSVTAAGYDYALDLMDRVVHKVGVHIYRQNIKTLYRLIDEIWDIKNVVYSSEATHLRGNFVRSLALFFSNNPMFWDERNNLKVPAKVKARLKTFPINDPSVRAMAGAGTSVLDDLYNKLLKHMNKQLAEKNRFK